VETLEWAGGNTVVNCHESGITLAGSSRYEYKLPRRGRALAPPMRINPGKEV